MPKPNLPPADPTVGIQAEIRRVQAETSRLDAELPPRVAELKRLTETYPSVRDLSSVAARRDGLRKAVYDRLYGVNVKLGEFRELHKKLQWAQGAVLLARMTAAPGKDVSRDIGGLLRLNDFTDPIVERLKAAEQAMQDDETAFQSEVHARAERRERRALLCWLAGAFALCGAGLAAGFAWRRRRLAEERAAAAAQASLPPPSAPPRPAQARLPASRLQPGALMGESLRVTGPPQAGPFGLLYPAVDLRTEKPVMVKQLSPELHQDERTFERLLDCARKTSTLKHRYVAETLAVFVEKDLIHLVSEPLQGQSLGAFLSSSAGRGLGLPAIQETLIPVIKAVHHAHDNDMIHGDLTPASVFVGPGGAVKVLDFMIGTEARKALAKFGWGAIGTPAYMAPEQELGASYKESDFFSFGVILYQMATGRLPFPGPDYLGAKRSRGYAPAKSLAPALPPRLELLLAKALEPDPQRRYHDALALLEDLESAGELP